MEIPIDILKPDRRDGRRGDRDLPYNPEGPPAGYFAYYYTDPAAPSCLRLQYQRIPGEFHGQKDIKAVQTDIFRACADAFLDAARKWSAGQTRKSRSSR